MQPMITLLLLVTLLLVAVPLIAAPPTKRVGIWLASDGDTVTDSALVATRSALQRISFCSLVVLLTAGLVVVVGDMPFVHLAAAGYALATVLGASVPLGGTDRRRASLTLPGLAGSARRAGRAALGIGVLTIVMAIALVTVLKNRTPGTQGALTLDESIVLTSAFGLAHVTSRQLLLIVFASLAILLAVLAGTAVANRRQSAAGVDSRIDQRLRDLSLHRIAFGGLGGQVILLGASIPALQIPAVTAIAAGNGSAPYSVSTSLVALLSVVGWVLIAAGTLSCAVAVLTPIWIQSQPAAVVDRRVGAAGPTSSTSTATDERQV